MIVRLIRRCSAVAAVAITRMIVLVRSIFVVI